MRWFRAVVAGALLLLLTGCQIRVVAGVEAHHDGSGVVRAGVGLDREALKEVPDLPNRLRVDDLRKAGWEVTDPAAEKDGLTWVRATKKFSTPAGADRAVRELSGTTGPFQGFRLRRQHSLFRTTTRFRGVVDLMMRRVREQLEAQGLGLELTDGAKNLLAAKGYDPSLGARPLRRAIQRMVEDPLSERILWKEFGAGLTIIVDAENDEVVFRSIESIEPPPVELAETGPPE